MNRAMLHIAALVLPLLGLGGLWLTTDRMSREGTEWEVPIQGYDPRDLLQGHYVQFQYDWPGRASSGPDVFDASYADLCLSGAAPNVQRVWIKAADDCQPYIRAGEAQQGRLYASQAEANRLQEQLWDRKLQGMVRIRVRADGHVTPLRLTFRARPPEAAPSPAPTR